MFLRFTHLACLTCVIATVVAQATGTAATSPSATPSSTIVQHAYGYSPNKPAAGIFAGLFGIVTVVLFFRVFSQRAWWGLCLPIGATFMTIGFSLRIPMTMHPNSEGYYLCSMLFILLSPAAFLAFNYILYGRFVISCIPRRHSLVRPERTAWYFVLSDVTTLLIQGVGGILITTATTNYNRVRTGEYVTIAGLSLQTLSFSIYILFVYYVYSNLKRNGVKPFTAPWSIILKSLFFSSGLFLTRCTYRTIQFAQLFGNGYISTHEVFFYLFDSLPLLVGISIYAVYWPSQCLQSAEEDGISVSTTTEVSLDP